MRAPDLIHALTCDFTLTALPDDSMALANWIKAGLLPVVEDVLDRYGAGPQGRDIDRIEIDLGTVSAHEAESELPRRLFAQLSTALEALLAEAPDDVVQEPALLTFLRSGSLPSLVRHDADDAHGQLLRDVIAMPQGSALLAGALRDPQMLTRLVRQFDQQELLAAAAALFAAWTPAACDAALAWAAEELTRLHGGEAESFWRWLLAQHPHPASPGALPIRWRLSMIRAFAPDAVRAIEEGLETADFTVLAPYWDRLLASAPQCLLAAHALWGERWLQRFDDGALADVLGLVHADCAWLVERLAVTVPRARLNALLRPAMRQWLAAPPGTLAPQQVLAWVQGALPQEASSIGAVFAQDDATRAHEQLRAALRTPDGVLRLVQQSDAPQLQAAFAVLFGAWPPAARAGVLAWARDEAASVEDAAAFWCWLLVQHAQPVGIDVLQGRWRQSTLRQSDSAPSAATTDKLFSTWPPAERASALAWAREEQQRLQDEGEDLTAFASWLLVQDAQPASHDALPDRWRLANAFTPDALQAIAQGLEQADFALLAPHWARILAGTPQLLRTAHPLHWERWLQRFDDGVLADILGVVQPQCAQLIDRVATVVPRRERDALMHRSMQQWLAAPSDTLAPQQIVAWFQAALPEHAARFGALLPARQVTDGAIDSTRLRAPLRVLGAIFTRAEIVTITRCLDTGAFALLAPHWDRLLVLAPHWLRTEYPRLARTWLAGFDDEVLIDILSVVQADCCALIEQLASDLPRQQLHATLRPLLAHWFALGVDQLTPQRLQADLRGIDTPALEAAIVHGDAGHLQQHWPAIVLSHRAALRRAWAQWPGAQRRAAIAGLTLEQRVDAALILQPAVAPLVAELQPQVVAAVLATAVHYLLDADVATVVPDQLMQYLLAQHAALGIELAPNAGRHVSAAMPAVSRDAVIAAAQASPAALRACIAACAREDGQFGQLNCAQLHALVRAWTGLQQAADGPDTLQAAIDTAALTSAAPHAFLGKVLQQAMADEPIDLDQIGAQCGAMASPTMLADSLRDTAVMAPTAHGPSPVPPALLQALPRRLADALLRADLAPLDAVWRDILKHHPDLLAQAAQRYLGRADVRNRLIEHADTARLQDLLTCLSTAAAQLIAPLLDSADHYAALLPTALAPAPFRQRVLRFAFDRVLASPGTVDWVTGLLRALLPMRPPAWQVRQEPVAYAWHELLRGSGSLLEAAFAQALTGGACLDATLQRLHSDDDNALPAPLQQMLTMALCGSHPALTDRLLAGGALADAGAAVFSATEWQALAQAQLPRQPEAAQQAFWRAYSAHLPAPGGHRRPDGEAVQHAYAAAFATLAPPAQPAAIAGTVSAPADAANADTIAMLLMRAQAPDAAASACIIVLLQRWLGDARGHAALHSALSDPRARDRLLAILPTPTLARLLCVLAPDLAGALPAVLRQMSAAMSFALAAVPAMLDHTTWRAIYTAAFTGARPTSAAALARALHPDSDAPPAGHQPPLATATPADAMTRLLEPLVQPVVAVQATVQRIAQPVPFTGDANLRNAGMVIVAPYIERLFDLLDITVDGAFISEETRQRGVHLLQYVVTAEESTPEHQLALNKLLCGIPAGVPLVLGITVTDKERDTILQMLGGVIKHWSAIGSTTVEGLRETFLQREGSLYYQDEAWQMKVPQRGVDILLYRLPWGYKMIKFSWMAAPLNVTWR